MRSPMRQKRIRKLVGAVARERNNDETYWGAPETPKEWARVYDVGWMFAFGGWSVGQ